MLISEQCANILIDASGVVRVQIFGLNKLYSLFKQKRGNLIDVLDELPKSVEKVIAIVDPNC